MLCKLKIQKVKGENFNFLIYGRASNNLDIKNHRPDKINIFITFTNGTADLFGLQNYNIIHEVNNINLSTYTVTFINSTHLTSAITIKNKLNITYPYVKDSKLSNIIFKDGIYNNDEQIFETDYSIFENNDQHFFGIQKNIYEDLGFFTILEYSIHKSYFQIHINNLTLNNDYFINPLLDNFLRFNENDTENIVFNSGNETYPFNSYCSKGCAKCDLTNKNCFYCFNRGILNITSNCSYNCDVLTNNYNSYLSECESLDNMNLINITFDENKISSTSLNNIKQIFDTKNKNGSEFLIIIKQNIDINPENQYFSEITFTTHINKNLNINSFDTYFNNKPRHNSFKINWYFYYKIINIIDYKDIQLYGKCLDPTKKFFPTSNNRGNCVINCGLGFYNNLNNICIKCFQNCETCDENNCLTCKKTHLLYKGICVSSGFNCLDIEFCNRCDALDGTLCVECDSNYQIFKQKCLQMSICRNGDINCSICSLDQIICLACNINYTLYQGTCLENTNCLIKDPNCFSCNLLEKNNCSICLPNYTLYQGTCLGNINCLIKDPNCFSCNSLEKNNCLTCKENYTVKNGICLENSNCLLNDPNCNTCYLDNFKICANCNLNYTLQKGICIHKTNCLLNIRFCKTCQILDQTKCLDCINNYYFFSGTCLIQSDCLTLIENCVLCFLNDKTICEKCKKGFFLKKI